MAKLILSGTFRNLIMIRGYDPQNRIEIKKRVYLFKCTVNQRIPSPNFE